MAPLPAARVVVAGLGALLAAPAGGLSELLAGAPGHAAERSPGSLGPEGHHRFDHGPLTLADLNPADLQPGAAPGSGQAGAQGHGSGGGQSPRGAHLQSRAAGSAALLAQVADGVRSGGRPAASAAPRTDDAAAAPGGSGAVAADTGAPGAAGRPAADLDPQQELEEEAREGNTEALAKEAQNPVASLISVPIQWNSTPASQWAPTSVDPAARANRTFNIWNLQPVVPVALNARLNLISRVIVPVIQRPWQGDSDAVGIGDINPTVFFVPRTRSRLQFGVGPTLLIPSATDARLGSQRWSAGPAAVAVYSRGPLVGGMLVNNVWSFAGSGGQPVSAMLIQPFLNINFPSGWYLASSPIITADWMARGGRGWTLPIGGGVGRVFRIGRQPFNSSLQVFWNALRPVVGGEDLLGPVTIRLQLQALFPTGR